MAYEISRAAYAALFGPTTGDKVQLGDTGLIAEVERDFTIYGDECVFGAGKVIRDGMGQAAGVDFEPCSGLRHHQCPHHRLSGHREGRRRYQERARSPASARLAIRT